MFESFKKLIALAVLAASAVAKYIATNAAQAKVIEDQGKALTEKDNIIADLRSQLESAGVSKEQLAAAQQRADEAEARSKDLQGRVDEATSLTDEAEAAAAELATALEEHPNTPTVDPATFEVKEEGDPVGEPGEGAPIEQK